MLQYYGKPCFTHLGKVIKVMIFVSSCYPRVNKRWHTAILSLRILYPLWCFILTGPRWILISYIFSNDFELIRFAASCSTKIMATTSRLESGPAFIVMPQVTLIQPVNPMRRLALIQPLFIQQVVLNWLMAFILNPLEVDLHFPMLLTVLPH